MDSLGEKIRQLRKGKKLSQEEFAFRLNVSRQAVSRWENDEMVPNADNLRSICEVLDADAGYLLFNEPAPPLRKMRTAPSQRRRKHLPSKQRAACGSSGSQSRRQYFFSTSSPQQ